jgi:hypothetical protein
MSPIGPEGVTLVPKKCYHEEYYLPEQNMQVEYLGRRAHLNGSPPTKREDNKVHSPEQTRTKYASQISR